MSLPLSHNGSVQEAGEFGLQPDNSSAYFWHKTAWHEIETKIKSKANGSNYILLESGNSAKTTFILQ